MGDTTRGKESLAEWDAIGAVRAQLGSDKHWRNKLDRAGAYGVHLAVFIEPWLSWLLDGSRTIESRFSVRRTIPYESVLVGDVVLLKASSGPIKGVCEVADTWYFDVEQTGLTTIRDRFGEAIGGGDELWRSVRDTRYVTLLKIRAPRVLTPIACPKRDRRGWVVLRRAP